MTFHEGELAVQRRAGVADRASSVGKIISSEVPPVAADFLARQPFVVIGGEAGSEIHASILFGEPGFATSPSPSIVRLAARPPEEDPLSGLGEGDHLGMLAIEFATRRRMRVNGTITEIADGLEIAVHQAYSNCPKYITRRPPPTPRAAAMTGGSVVRESNSAWLSPAARELISRSDTFFLATKAPGFGADVSHRGGPPGFVELTDRGLLWPDYKGNSMFNSFGNLELDPRAGLLFMDFASGRMLHLSGQARVNWSEAAAQQRPGAERLVEFEIASVAER